MDVAFLIGEPSADGCDMAHLWNEQVYVTLPDNHELAVMDKIHWTDLRGQHFLISKADPGPDIHNYLIKHLGDLGHAPSVERHDVSAHNLMSLIAIGRGLTLTCEATTAAQFPGVVDRPLADELLPFYALWSPRNDNPALRRLLSLARTMSERCRLSAMTRSAANPSAGPAPASAHDTDGRAAPSQNRDRLR
jgi:hypothetical protein